LLEQGRKNDVLPGRAFHRTSSELAI
jgi:hypothetical protein